MGVDDTSKGVRIYWPDKRNVTVERNVYYDKTGASASRFEGEDWDDFVETKVDELTGTSTTVPQSSTPAPNPEPTSRVREPPIMDDTASDAASEPEVRSKRVQKPTQRVKDLLEGRGVTSDLPKGPKVAPGVQLPTEEPSILEAMLAKLAPGYQEEDLPMAADFLEEYAMAAEISEAEALEPHTLAKAKSRPDWPLGEGDCGGVGAVEEGWYMGGCGCTTERKYCWFKMGFPREEGCCWECRTLQGTTRRTRVLPSAWS